jgi:hypothetical protein
MYPQDILLTRVGLLVNHGGILDEYRVTVRPTGWCLHRLVHYSVWLDRELHL